MRSADSPHNRVRRIYGEGMDEHDKAPDPTGQRHKTEPTQNLEDRAKALRDELVDDDAPEPLPGEDRPGYPDPQNPSPPNDSRPEGDSGS